ncbi:sigma-54-dependent transcriptional regulator [Thermodesulfobacteriota bacterium]
MSKPLVMLVDDEVPFVETLTKRLEKRSLQIISAHDGQEALEKLNKNRNVDVVILDVKMPGMDGIEVLREIKKTHPLIEVIMLTGHATVDTAIEGMKLGAYDYLMKPCELEELMLMVEEATKKRRKHEEKTREAEIRKALSTHGLS